MEILGVLLEKPLLLIIINSQLPGPIYSVFSAPWTYIVLLVLPLKHQNTAVGQGLEGREVGCEAPADYNISPPAAAQYGVCHPSLLHH